MTAQENNIDIEESTQSNWNQRFWLMTALMLVLRLFMALYLDLNPDESYYWQLSKNLDWSYFDHPPMVAWLIAASRSIFGENAFHIRAVALLAGVIASWFVFITGKEFLNSPKAGFLAAALANFSPAGVVVGFITTPDTPLYLAWSIGIYAFLKAINDQRRRWWIVTGLALAFGALSKYNMILFVPGIAVTILAFKRYRHLVFTQRYWLMVILAAIGTIPIIYWNYQHDWVSIRFQLEHGTRPANRSIIKNFGDYLGGQLATVGLTLLPLIWFITLKHIKSAFTANDEKRFFLAWLALPGMLLFSYTGMSAKVEANWPQMAYLSAILLTAEWILQASNLKKRLAWVISPSLILAVLAVTHGLTLFMPIPPRADISARMHGWQEFGKTIRRIDRDFDADVVFVSQGTTLGTMLSFYGNIPAERVAELHSAGNYQIWWQNRELEKGSDAVFVDDDRFPEAMHYTTRFASFTREIYNIRACNKKVRTINVTKMYNLQSPMKFIDPRVKLK